MKFTNPRWTDKESLITNLNYTNNTAKKVQAEQNVTQLSKDISYGIRKPIKISNPPPRIKKGELSKGQIMNNQLDTHIIDNFAIEKNDRRYNSLLKNRKHVLKPRSLQRQQEMNRSIYIYIYY